MISVRKLIATTAITVGTLAVATSAIAADAICYNCPPQWADWKSQLEAVKKDTGISLPHDNKNSGQTLSQLIADRMAPAPADMAPVGGRHEEQRHAREIGRA